MKLLFIAALALLHFISGAAAATCPKGSYQNRKKPDSCNLCPAGTYNEFEGAQGPDLCLKCPAGTYNSQVGADSASACRPCPDGKASPIGATQCIKCWSGRYISNDPQPKCTRCSPNSVSKGRNNLSCIRCFNDLLPNQKQTKCRRCPRGFGSTVTGPQVFACQKCFERTFNDGKYATCQSCPSFMITNSDGTGCVPCPPGRAREQYNSRCRRCPAGLRSKQSRPICVADGTPCPANHFLDANSACRTCTRREKYTPWLKKCTGCPKNSVSEGGLDRVCKPCPQNTIASLNRCICKEGLSGLPPEPCKPCPLGTRYVRIFTEQGVCVKCTIGTFSNEAGGKECKACPPGQVQPLEGQSSCIPCPIGLIASNLFIKDIPDVSWYSDPGRQFLVGFGSERVRSTCVVPQTNCPPGKERIVDKGGRFFCQPKSCPSDSLEIMKKPSGFGGLVRICVSCVPGTVLDTAEGKCKYCKVDEVSPGGIVTECTKCPDSSINIDNKCECVTNWFGQRQKGREIRGGRCRPCKPGTYGIIGTGVCKKCRPGTYSQGYGTSKCFNCRPGEYAPTEGSASCFKCPNGTMTYGFGEPTCVRIGTP